MIAGTFREWVDDNMPGIFTATDALDITTNVQLAEYTRGQITYDVTVGGRVDGGLVAYAFSADTVCDLVARGYLTWDTRGEVTDG